MSKTQYSCFFNKTLNWLVCGSMSRSKEEFDDAARQPCRTVIPDPNLYKSGSMSRCGCSKTRPWFGNISRSETCGHFSVCLACPKKCGLWDVHPLRFESLRPIVPHLPKFESKIITCVNFLISTIAAHGAAFFWSNKRQTDYGLSKTSAPKPAKKMRCIGMYRNVQLHWFSSYTCITPFFRVIHV